MQTQSTRVGHSQELSCNFSREIILPIHGTNYTCGDPCLPAVATSCKEYSTSSPWQILSAPNNNNNAATDRSDQGVTVSATVAGTSNSGLWSSNSSRAASTLSSPLGLTETVVDHACKRRSTHVAIRQSGIHPLSSMPTPLVAAGSSLQCINLLPGAQPPGFSSDGACWVKQQQGFVGNPPVWPPTLQLVFQPSSQAAWHARTLQAPLGPATGVGAAVVGASSAAISNACIFFASWAKLSLADALLQLWSSQQVQQAKGGRLFSTDCRKAWHVAGGPELCYQDLYVFCKLKHVLHKLDVAHRIRVRLVKRLHAVVDYGDCDLKSVYLEVRCIISDFLHGPTVGLEGARVIGLVRLALAMQEASLLGSAADGVF